jgi:hypothetical protein
MRAAAIGFESGLTAFIGLSRIKKRVKSNPFTNNPQVQTEDVIYNPINPENPDSKPDESG